MAEQKRSELTPSTAALLDQSYKALVSALRRDRSVAGALAAYANARRQSSAETVLMPDTTADQMQIIRGKAQFMTELLTLCEAAKAPDDDEGDEDA